MPRKCNICEHLDREAIELALAQPNAPLSRISRSYSVSHDALERHRRNHWRPAVRQALSAREELSPAKLIQRLVGYLDEAEAGIAIAKKSGNLTGLARCIKEARETAVYLGKAQGMWSEKGAIVHDNRTQIAIANMTEAELRALVALSEPRPRAVAIQPAALNDVVPDEQ